MQSNLGGMAEVASPRKVVLVTDPGRDIDDVVTLITLAGANFTFPGEPADPSKYELVGIVTSGGRRALGQIERDTRGDASRVDFASIFPARARDQRRAWPPAKPSPTTRVTQ